MNPNWASLLKFWTFVLDIQTTAKVYEAVTLNLSLPKTKSFILLKNTKKKYSTKCNTLYTTNFNSVTMS